MLVHLSPFYNCWTLITCISYVHYCFEALVYCANVILMLYGIRAYLLCIYTRGCESVPCSSVKTWFVQVLQYFSIFVNLITLFRVEFIFKIYYFYNIFCCFPMFFTSFDLWTRVEFSRFYLLLINVSAQSNMG